MGSELCAVTGASGHVGYALLKELVKNGERVRIVIRKDLKIFDDIDCEKVMGDVTDITSLEKAFEGVDVVYHLAGVIDVNVGNEELIYKVNVEGTKNVVRACEKCGVRRLVYASSVDAFKPLENNEIMSENDEFDPDILEGTYAKTKAIATQYVLNKAKEGRLEVVVVHPGACIGPYDFKVSNVGEMVRMFLSGKFPVTMDFGAYNFVDIRDVAKGTYAAAKKGKNAGCYILTGSVTTVDELIHILSEICDVKPPKLVLKKWMADAFAPIAEVYYKAANKTPLFTRYSIRKLMSNCNFCHDRAEKELGYKPMSIKESLTDMVNWIRENEQGVH